MPGPSAPISIAGEELVGLRALYPNLLSQCVCVSYRGSMWLSFVVDASHPDPNSLATFYLDELSAPPPTGGWRGGSKLSER